MLQWIYVWALMYCLRQRFEIIIEFSRYTLLVRTNSVRHRCWSRILEVLLLYDDDTRRKMPHHNIEKNLGDYNLTNYLLNLVSRQSSRSRKEGYLMTDIQWSMKESSKKLPYHTNTFPASSLKSDNPYLIITWRLSGIYLHSALS